MSGGGGGGGGGASCGAYVCLTSQQTHKWRAKQEPLQ